MLRTIENVSDGEIRSTASISVIVGDAEPLFILPPPEGEDNHPGLRIVAEFIEAAERRVADVLGESMED